MIVVEKDLDPAGILFVGPNPFEQLLDVTYKVTEESSLRLAVLNSTLHEVHHVDLGTKMPGEHLVTWDSGTWPKGVYFIVLETVSTTGTRKRTSAKVIKL